MKKIAILATHLGVINRGVESFVIELVKKLRDDFEIDIYATGMVDDIKENIIRIDIKKSLFHRMHEKQFNKCGLYYKIINRFFYFLIPDILYQRKFTQKVFKDYINDKDYDLLFPNNGIWGAIYSKKLRDKKSTPFIYTGHGGIGYGEEQILMQEPDMYVALTKNNESWAREFSVNVTTIYNGINLNKFEMKHDKNNDQKTIVSVGALTEFKRHNLTIDAVSMLEDVKLVILGRGELQDKISEKGMEKLKERFTINAVPYEEIMNYYHMADLFVLPSLNEPFGIVYLEALASNLPIVAPDDEVRREIIGQAGLYCDCSNAEEYSEKIKSALDTDWGDIPRKRAELFDWNKSALSYKELFERTIQKNENRR
ncbi:hypothetical protein CFOLD11_40970 [Clostridium folliculivorans]|uniref:Glycosyl transferase family 1 domain-containing protein n=1 Tax=Clostridium folliculivorans TaxID=2886038 RepID=A0A9W6DC96_9CLOT|nr:glycosyltransferase family 4 protein [Clostridium folliculivorans]GKU27270.1 hypothetical protein CFOLD11_40970 [Clostridium folliculivorans]